jgi:SAM-dependent methyltransferase
MATEDEVAKHYHHGRLEQAILAALIAAGKDPEKLTAIDLAAVDEFHLGWLPATYALADNLDLDAEMHVLDIGAGIGGPARAIAERRGCRVTGIDLTEEFVAVAGALTARCGLSDKVSFQKASALALPFAAASFDAALLIHVGMNIEDKRRLFAEARRVSKPAARFGVYDIMRIAEGEITYPTPWAATRQTSFVAPAETYRDLLADCGFVVESEHSRRDEVLGLWQEMRARREKEGPPVLGLHVLMGPEAPTRLANVIDALERGLVAPIEILARAR